VVSFTPHPVYPMGKNHWYPLDGRLGGPQNWSEHCREEKDTLPLPAIEPKYLSKWACSLVVILMAL